MNKKISVYFFGDSICFGQGVSIHETWVSQISSWLSKRYRADGYATLVQSYSINGNTTRMALERIAYDIQGKDIDLLVVQFGINDANIWMTDKGNPRVSRLGFAANLQEIVDRVKRFDVKRIILNTNHIIARKDVLPNSNVRFCDHLVEYNKVIREVAAQNTGYVTLMDIEQAVRPLLDAGKTTEERYMMPDKVHLSVEGNEIYYAAFQPVFESVLDEMFAEGLL